MPVYDAEGFPRDTGATDMWDSARLGGLMALLRHPQAPDCSRYLVDGRPTRHPTVTPDDFSRDQLVPWIAGYWKQAGPLPVAYKPSNRDILSPSQQDHVRRCQGKPDTLLGRAWLWADILYSAYVDPMAEPNQLIAMLVVAGPKWVRRWMRLNKNWREAVMAYWGGWRNEAEFAEFIIYRLEWFVV